MTYSVFPFLGSKEFLGERYFQKGLFYVACVMLKISRNPTRLLWFLGLRESLCKPCRSGFHRPYADLRNLPPGIF